MLPNISHHGIFYSNVARIKPNRLRTLFATFCLLLTSVSLPLLSGCAGCEEVPGGGGGVVVTQLHPEVQMSVTAVDFESYRVGKETFREIVIGNTGKADLKIGSVFIDGDELGAFLVELDQSVIGPGATATMTVTFAPQQVGESASTLSIGTNDEDEGTILIPISGIGTQPNIFVSPTNLMFTEIQAGEVSASQVIEISNQGTGFLQVQGISLNSEAESYFEISLPSSFIPGFRLDEGLTLPIRVTYQPPADGLEESHIGFIQILSDSPSETVIDVSLAGTSSETPVDLLPEIVIYEPDPKGTAFLGQPVLFDVEVYGDEGEDVRDMIVSWFSSIDGPIPSDLIVIEPFDEEEPNEGGFLFTTTGLTVGLHKMTVFVIDPGGNLAQAQVDVEIWNEESELNYVITGSSGVFSYFTVDDNLEIYRISEVLDEDGEVVLDENGDPEEQYIPCVIWVDDLSRDTTHPPVPCNAVLGDKIRVLAFDRYAAGASVSGLTLRFGDESQVLTEPFETITGSGGDVCLDSPQKDDWYDEHDTPNTNDCVFLDVTIEVAIPTIPVPSE